MLDFFLRTTVEQIWMQFSVVMLIHNEEKLLSYSLPSIYRLDPSEVVLIFDNCSDESELVLFISILHYFLYF